MLIDWPTVIFQIINFLILIALLKRFLYGPILKAMDDRELQVAARLAQAAKTEKEASERAADLAREQEKFAEARENMLTQVREEVEEWKNDALLRLQVEVEQKREGWNSIITSEREDFLHKLKQLISRNVFLIARKALADLADDELEARLISTFVAKITNREEGVEALISPTAAKIKCFTGFPLGESQKEQLEKALSLFLCEGGKLFFQQDSDLGLGIRLINDDKKWEWNLNRYMLGLETQIHKAMNSFSGVDYGQ